MGPCKLAPCSNWVVRESARKRWLISLRNHREIISAMHFFAVPTATFRVPYCLFVIGHRRRVLHFNVTEHPTSSWIEQPLRAVFPDDTVPRCLLLDRGRKYEGRPARSISESRTDSGSLPESLEEQGGGTME